MDASSAAGASSAACSAISQNPIAENPSSAQFSLVATDKDVTDANTVEQCQLSKELCMTLKKNKWRVEDFRVIVGKYDDETILKLEEIILTKHKDCNIKTAIHRKTRK